MKRAFIYFLIIFLALITALTAWQRNNIATVITVLRYSKQELTEKIDKSKKLSEIQIGEYTDGIIRDFTHEEEEKIRRGETTPEEAISLKNEQDGFLESEKPQTQTDALINQSAEQLYLLKATYIGKLGSLERQAKADYKSYLKEKKSIADKNKLIAFYIKEVAALESECDNAVSEVLKTLETELKAQKADIKIVKSMKKAYEEEKILKKSYFLSQYK